MVDVYKYLGVHINNKFDWSDNISVLYRKDQSRLQQFIRTINFGACRVLWKKMSWDCSCISNFAAISWSGGITEKDKKRLNKLITERYQRLYQHILALRLGSNTLIGPVSSLGQYIYPYSEYLFIFYLEVQYFSVNVSIHDVYIAYSVIIIVLFLSVFFNLYFSMLKFVCVFFFILFCVCFLLPLLL